MSFRTPVCEEEGSLWVAWHVIGLSPRDMSEMTLEADYEHVERSTNTIYHYLRRNGYTPHISHSGPNTERQTHCSSERHPGEVVARTGPNNECSRCKTVRSKERRGEVRTGLAERVAKLRAMGGEAAEIADWIAIHVRVK